MKPHASHVVGTSNLPRLGVYPLPYATLWPELSSQLRALYNSRLSRVPWLPAGWLASVNALHGKNGQVMVIAPSRAAIAADASFLDTPAKEQWWDELADRSSAAVVKYAAGKAAEGRREIALADADLAFWSRAHALASVLALPVTAAQAAWKNPGLVGIVLWGGLGLVAFFAIRTMIAGKNRS